MHSGVLPAHTTRVVSTLTEIQGLDKDTVARRRALRELARAPIAKLREIAVAAGIYNADGTLTDYYRADSRPPRGRSQHD